MAVEQLNFFKSTILPRLKDNFPSCVIDEGKSSSKEINFCLNLLSKDEAEHFKQVFSEVTNAEWIVYRSASNLQRFSFSKKWICQHSKRNKKNLELKRNAECKAKLHITIKNVTKDTLIKDVYLRQKPALRGEIKVELQHTHNTTSAEALKMLRVNDEVKESFFDYFSNGMTPAEARRFHENKFLLDEEFKSLANAAINSTLNQVQYLHCLWRQANLGSLINPFEKLKEKIPLYEANGTTVHIQNGDSWAVVLATSVMKRIQKSQFAKEMIFVDSTSGCEGSSSTMTVLLVASKVGALPICVLIHPNQTMESYINAFDLMKNNFPQCFGGNDHPEIFMTDDSSAEKKGVLKRVWEKSKQLLCHFHVAQAEWRWLFTHDIPKDERPRLMRLFQAVMYATSKNDLDRATCEILNERINYLNFVKRFESFYKRKHEWVLLFRQDLPTRQNNTNNLAEISIRILKDIVLCRTKAFNVVALCEFCITVWECYIIKRLLDYAYSRKHEVSILYSSLFNKSTSFREDDIETVNASIYKIKCEENDYIINVDIGACSCAAGISGAFCKHQCFLMNLKKMRFPNAPPISQLDRHELALLALGPKCPEMSFFSEFKYSEEPSGSDMNAMPQPEPSATKGKERNLQIIASPQMATTEQKESLSKEFERLASLVSGELSSDCAIRLLNNLKKIETVNDFKHVFVVRKFDQRTKKIKVQPTSIARRQGLVKSSTKLPSGRPPLSAIKKDSKRKRQLHLNILNNTQNVKSHH